MTKWPTEHFPYIPFPKSSFILQFRTVGAAYGDLRYIAANRGIPVDPAAGRFEDPHAGDLKSKMLAFGRRSSARNLP